MNAIQQLAPFVLADAPDPRRSLLPPAPATIAETGLDLGSLLDLCLKTLYYAGRPSARQVSERMCLDFSIVQQLLTFLRKQEFAEIVGADGTTETEYQYSITSKGIERAREALEVNQYVGPAPVPYAEYIATVHRQTITQVELTPNAVRDSLAHLVLSDTTREQLGAAVVSGSSLFLYGEPGNGKSTIAEAIGTMLTDPIMVPHAIDVFGQIVRVFDPRVHLVFSNEGAKQGEGDIGGMSLAGGGDRRWVATRRPLIIVGGELTMGDLELRYSPTSRFYVAPLQLKANGGILVVDDFGRQLMRPEELLNRWMVPMERHTDHLTFHTGETVEVPFDVLLVFSSNLTPSSLGDEAFFRRIRHKVRVSDPTEAEFREILARVARRYRIGLEPDAVEYFIAHYYYEQGRHFRSVQPRDVLLLIGDAAKYQGIEPVFTRASIDAACLAYFTRD